MENNENTLIYEDFFIKLSELCGGEFLNDHGKVVTANYSANRGTFSFRVYMFDGEQEVYNCARQPDFESEVYYNWVDKKIQEEILHDIEQTLESLGDGK